MKHIKRAAHKIKAAGVDPAAVSPIVYNLYDSDRFRLSMRCLILDKNTNRWLIYYEGGSINTLKDSPKLKEIILNNMFKVSKRLNYILPDMPGIIYVPPTFYIPLEEINYIDEDKLQN